MIPGKKLTLEEKKAIEELHGRIKNDLPATLSGDNLVLHNFLKARDFDVDKAEKMLRKHIHWRKVYQIDTLLEDFKPKEFYIKYVEPTFLGLDKAGHMVNYYPSGKLVPKDILRCTTINNYVRHLIWNYERIKKIQKQENEKEKTHNWQNIIIFDQDGFTFAHATQKATTDFLKKFTHIAQDNYPEFLKTIYIINCPSYFVSLYSIVTAIIATPTLKKIKIFGQNGWKEKLVEDLGADVLPAFLGGNRTDPDGNPMCSTFVKHGGMMPTNYYLSNEDRYFKDQTEVKNIIIPANERKEIQVEVTEYGLRIEWEYFLKNNDIGFGLDFYVSEGDAECILPIERFSTPDGKETGFYRCKKLGRYAIIFDNSHSWMTSKEVDCVVKISKG